MANNHRKTLTSKTVVTKGQCSTVKDMKGIVAHNFDIFNISVVVNTFCLMFELSVVSQCNLMSVFAFCFAHFVSGANVFPLVRSEQGEIWHL